MTYYQIEDKIYYLNLDNIFSIVSETPNNEKIVNTAITQYYGSSDEFEENPNASKEIVETKSNLNETMNNVRYDIIKILLSCLLTNNYNYDGAPVSVLHLKDFSVPQMICLNTLIEYKILSEVETNE